ncbi:MAG: fumarylacetoacetate hydrolase family protein [Geminicoccaceae bacterium]
MQEYLTPGGTLPEDGTEGTLVGRAWVPGAPAGPSVVAIREAGVFDLSKVAPTMADLLNAEDPVALARAEGAPLGDLEPILENSAYERRDPALPYVLGPCDLQALKAAGVTFATSLLERVIEEQARGDASKALAIRRNITEVIGTDLSRVRPGSEAALRLKEHLVAQRAWSQYLEVGIGPYAEVFTKAQPMAAVGTGSEIGIHPESTWNNPEPEVVLAVSAAGRIAGASLGNDLNLRDFEGRSALLLGKAKDNNASCAIGPFIRLLDASFTLDRLRATTVSLRVVGEDGFELSGSSSMAEISRDVTDLVAQTVGPNHQYPDGFMLFAGTMFAPVQDRDQPGQGFTHKVGDLVAIGCPELGTLANRVNRCDAIAPWTFGAGALMRNLAARGLL